MRRRSRRDRWRRSTNLTWALDEIAKKMDPAEDVLLLYVTTHGSHEHELLVDLDPLPLDQIAPG